MFVRLKTILYISAALTLVTAASPVQAQTYKGDYRAAPKPQEKDMAAKPVPKVFSSEVSSAAQAQKLDYLYYNLFVTLRNFAVTDGVYKAKLYDLLDPQRFKYTRYSEEFSGDLKAAMDDLNANYKAVRMSIDDAKVKYEEIKRDINITEHEKLDALWEEKLGEFTQTSDRYFKLQNQFLNTYRTLVAFILKQGGSYYYKTGEDRVYFYRFEGYKYYGTTIDKLNKINFEQNKLIDETAPKNIEHPYQ